MKASQSIKFYREDKFKETPIGKIPEDWKITRIRNIAKIIMGQSPPSSMYNKRGEGLPFIQGKAEFKFIYPSPVLYCSKPIKIANINDILISVRAPVGDVNLAPYRLCIGRGLAAIRFNDKTSYLFYFYYFQKIKKFLEVIGKGSTFKAIVKNDLENLIVPLPPLEEQKVIAQIFSTVDEDILKTDEIIAKTERLKKGLMQQLLTKGIGHKEFKETPIGKIPKEWEVVKLNELGTFQYGYTTSAKDEDTGIKFLRITDIKENGMINWSTTPFCEIDKSNFRKYKLKDGDILFTRIGATTGKTCYITNPPKSIFGSYLIRFIPRTPKINTKFLHIFTQSSIYWLQINRIKEGQLKKGINTKTLGQLKLPLPPLQEQEKIIEIFSPVDRKLEVEKKRKEKLEKIKRGLMDLLLTGKVRVMI